SFPPLLVPGWEVPVSDEGTPWRVFAAEAQARFAAAGIASPEVSVRRIVERAAGFEGSEYGLGLGEPATERAMGFFDQMVERHLTGEPLQYVVGEWSFRTLDLMVDRRALIPRPETEQVVEAALAELDRLAPASPRVLDLGTGSGAIALSVAVERPAARVWAVDASADALAVARANLAGIGHAGSRVTLLEGSWFDALPREQRDTFDLIVSNPPWVPTPDREVELFRGGGLDGESITRQLFEGAGRRLAPGGRMAIYVEYPHLSGQTYPERVRGWLGQGDWGIAVVNLLHLSAEEYVAGQVASHTGQDIDHEFERWMVGYEAAGIKAMSRAVVYVVPGQRFEATLEADHPTEPQDWVGPWLEGLGRPGNRLHSKAQLWTSGERARVEWPGTCLHPLELDPAQQAAVAGESSELRARMVLE
ncbi:MAG: peptide chain release factor N(5)-glutamine methyltransferase, partial [Candidatus Eremiobacteraeota bacterium]|nr:peptide chain release factor N(5)-glutamine methyltransferase [Candidatus Eremiobacteraeota bacterium]